MEDVTLQEEIVGIKKETLNRLKEVCQRRDFVKYLDTVITSGNDPGVIRLANQIRYYLLDESGAFDGVLTQNKDI